MGGSTTNYYTSNYLAPGGGWGGFTNPYYGYHDAWYRGSWGGNYLGGWIGPSYGGSGYAVYDAFPTWGGTNLLTWGLGTLGSSWLSSVYTNPYYVAPIAVGDAAPATVVYDYSHPIDATIAPPEPSASDTALQDFEAARDAFLAGDYDRALDLTDRAVEMQPNDPALHEFRALALFALGRYDEAAGVAYAVLTAGPGWNWTTLASLYPDIDTYTNQLRALEAHVRSDPQSASDRFLLGYHYLVQGNAEAARDRFADVTTLQPSDKLSARFVKALTKPESAATDGLPDPEAAQAAESRPAEEPPPGPPPADLAGTWEAQPSPDTTITLDLKDDGAFLWKVATKGRTEILEGQAAFRDEVLTLAQEEGPPLAGKVEKEAGEPDTFSFHLLGGPEAPALAFTR